MNKKIIEITDPYEMERFVKENKYLLVDDGMDEYVIKESDVADYIFNRNEDINIYKPDEEFLLSTIGFFLNRIDYDYRNKIIDILVRLQTNYCDSNITYYCESTILDYIEG